MHNTPAHLAAIAHAYASIVTSRPQLVVSARYNAIGSQLAIEGVAVRDAFAHNLDGAIINEMLRQPMNHVPMWLRNALGLRDMPDDGDVARAVKVAQVQIYPHLQQQQQQQQKSKKYVSPGKPSTST